MKKVNYLLSALMLAGGVSMTSCMETEEPEGVKELRLAEAQKEKAIADSIVATTKNIDARTATITIQNDIKEIEKQIKQFALDTLNGVKDIAIQTAIQNAKTDLQDAIANLQLSYKTMDNLDSRCPNAGTYIQARNRVYGFYDNNYGLSYDNWVPGTVEDLANAEIDLANEYKAKLNYENELERTVKSFEDALKGVQDAYKTFSDNYKNAAEGDAVSNNATWNKTNKAWEYTGSLTKTNNSEADMKNFTLAINDAEDALNNAKEDLKRFKDGELVGSSDANSYNKALEAYLTAVKANDQAQIDLKKYEELYNAEKAAL